MRITRNVFRHGLQRGADVLSGAPGSRRRFSALTWEAVTSASAAFRSWCCSFLPRRTAGHANHENALRRWAVALLFVSALLLMGAAGDRTGQRFDRLGHNLMCQCGCGQIMLECNHVGCRSSEQMRKELKFALDRGDSDDVILAGFVSQYGPTVLAAPTHKGFDRVAWIMPVVIFIAGLTAVVLVVLAWKRHTPTPPSDSAGSAPGEMDEFRRRAREETSL